MLTRHPTDTRPLLFHAPPTFAYSIANFRGNLRPPVDVKPLLPFATCNSAVFIAILPCAESGSTVAAYWVLSL